MMKRLLQTVAAIGLASSSLACMPTYSSVEIDTISTPPASATVRDSFIEIPAGVAVVIRAEPLSDNHREYDGGTALDLYSSNRNIFTTYPRPSSSEFVIVGLEPGNACLEVVVEGDQEDCIDVTVLPPAT